MQFILPIISNEIKFNKVRKISVHVLEGGGKKEGGEKKKKKKIEVQSFSKIIS